jgi:uncharacterized protein
MESVLGRLVKLRKQGIGILAILCMIGAGIVQPSLAQQAPGAAEGSGTPLNLAPSPSQAKPAKPKRNLPKERAADRQRTQAARSAPERGNEQDDTMTELAALANANTVSIISGSAASTYFRVAGELALVLDKDQELRVLAVQGRGAVQNAYDVLLLRGIDMGLTQADTFERLKGDTRIKDLNKQFTYIARLFNDELHVIAPKNVTDIRQLEGKKVSFDVAGSGTDYTGRTIFGKIGLNVEPINVDQITAMQMLNKGELAAVVSVSAKPSRFVSEIEAGTNLHLLDVPYDESLGALYPPATIAATDYPKLLPPDRTVNTVAVGTILAAYNWPKGSERYKRIARFTDAFFTNFEKFREPQRHPKWKEVNLSAETPGWTRFPAAIEWLERNKTAKTEQAQFTAFEQFLKQNGTLSDNAAGADKAELFKEFLEWQKKQP